MKRLVRSKTDRQISGVCSGLAQYFNIDASIVRLIFVVATLFGGPGLIAYIILAIVLPEETPSDIIEKTKNEDV
jgi:phage shock protein PspC (stress-responsive transcriptional regulator)